MRSATSRAARVATGAPDMLIVTLLILIGLLALAIPVAAGLGILGLSLSGIYSKLPLSLAIGEIAWGTSNNFLLVAIPFFVLLGEILLRSGMAERMYNALVLWVPWLPGGLMHSNIAACAMFAATSGSSVATAATIGTVALGEVEKRGYSERLFLGTIAAGGTLGILIPPSINMIVYGVLTETSIPKLYLAGFIPGVVLAALFMPDRPDRLPASGRTAGRTSGRDRLGRPHPHPARPSAAAVHLRGGDRLDLCRLGNANRGRIARRDRRSRPRGGLSPADLSHPAQCLRGNDAHHRHDHGDPARGLLPQLRHHVDRPHRPGEPLHYQPWPVEGPDS